MNNAQKFLASVLVVSATGLGFIATQESGALDKPRLVAYDDGVGIQTICHGHTKGVTKGMRATPAQCQAWLAEDAGYAGKIVGEWVTQPITQKQYDVLASFVLNVGGGKMGVKDGLVWLKNPGKDGKPRHSTLLKKINAGDCRGAGLAFLDWDNPKHLPGVKKRRVLESNAWLSECDQ